MATALEQPPSQRVTSDDVLERGRQKGIPFTAHQAEKIAIAATSMLESAARLRREIERNDEPAFGFSVPIRESSGA